MKKAYIYKGHTKDTDTYDLKCIDGQYLEGCLGFCCYYDLSCYVLSLFKDKVIDIEDNKKLKEKHIDRLFIEDEIDKIRVGKKSLIDEYVDVIDVENVAKVPRAESHIGYFLY